MKSVDFLSAQHVKVEFELAQPGHRALAALIDLLLFIIYFFIVFMVFSFDDPFSSNMEASMFLWLVIIKIPWIFYHPLVEYFTQGQSLGKYIVGIRVVTMNGERPGLREVFTRWMFRGDFLWISIDFLGFFIWLCMGVCGLGIMSVSRKKQRIGDVMANTMIIKNKSSVSYSLQDVLSIKSQSEHTPTYPTVTRFTDEDMMLIKNTIQRVHAYPTQEVKMFAIELANKSAELIGLPETPKKKMEFLQTLLQDYVVLTR